MATEDTAAAVEDEAPPPLTAAETKLLVELAARAQSAQDATKANSRKALVAPLKSIVATDAFDQVLSQIGALPDALKADTKFGPQISGVITCMTNLRLTAATE